MDSEDIVLFAYTKLAAATSGSSLASGFLGLGFPWTRARKNTKLKKNKHGSFF